MNKRQCRIKVRTSDTERQCRTCLRVLPIIEFRLKTRVTISGLTTAHRCRSCHNAYTRSYYAERREQICAGRRKQRQLKLEAIRLRDRESYANNPYPKRGNRFRYTYGPMHKTWVVHQHKLQQGRCAFCGKQGSAGSMANSNKLVTDHDHMFSTRDARGWRRLLCGNCNVGYGHFKESPVILAEALQAAIFDHPEVKTEAA